MPVYPYNGQIPQLGEGSFVAPTAEVMGDVVAGEDCSFWFQTVVRGDVNFIRIGARTNLQDGVIVHVTHETHPTHIGSGVVVGHAAILHGCTVDDGALIGIGARVLDGAVVEAGAQVGAGALVAPGHRIPSGYLALGVPARVTRPLSEREKEQIGAIADRYVKLKERYREDLPSSEERPGR